MIDIKYNNVGLPVKEARLISDYQGRSVTISASKGDTSSCFGFIRIAFSEDGLTGCDISRYFEANEVLEFAGALKNIAMQVKENCKGSDY